MSDIKQLPSLLTDVTSEIAQVSRTPATKRKSSKAAKVARERRAAYTPKATKPDGRQLMAVIQLREVRIVNGVETWEPLCLHDLPMNTQAEVAKALRTLACEAQTHFKEPL